MYKCINGWTKKKMIETINKGMKDHRSVNQNGTCLYRASDGNKCAIGCFIPDDYYNEDIELVTPTSAAFRDYLKYLPLPAAYSSLLQSIHDCCDDEKSPKKECIKWIENNVEGKI